jgi:hypothetical protein
MPNWDSVTKDLVIIMPNLDSVAGDPFIFMPSWDSVAMDLVIFMPLGFRYWGSIHFLCLVGIPLVGVQSFYSYLGFCC